MIARAIKKQLLISFLIFSSLCSFAQTLPVLQVLDSTKACDGYILWLTSSNCRLLDRRGHCLAILPGNLVAFFDHKQEIVAHVGPQLIKYNKDLDVMWKANADIHHELLITPDNNILMLSQEFDSINHVSIRFDNILCYSQAGNEYFRWSTFKQRRYLMDFMMKDTNIFRFKIKGLSGPDDALAMIARLLAGNKSFGQLQELFHINAVQVIPANESEKKDSVFRKGNILISFCNYFDSIASFIAIVHPVSYKILWYHVLKEIRAIHTPSMLPNGHILMYVNSTGLNERDSSYIEEIDPITKETAWKYIEKSPNSELRHFFGSCQRLPNGNTLISNASGFIYELTPSKEIVRQLFIDEKAMPVYRAILYDKKELKWLVSRQSYHK